MTKIKYSIVFLLFVFLAANSIFAGGGRRNGTAGATELLIPVGAQGIALGGATLTNVYGVEAIYWNPANVARMDNSTDVLFSHMDYIADIGVAYGAVAINVGGFGTIGLAIKSLSIGEIETTTVENPDGTGQHFTPQFTVIGLTYSKLLSDRISVGITANLISENIDRVSASGFSFNIGIAYTNFANIEGLSLAIAIKNLGPQMNYEGSGLLVNADATNYSRPDQLYKLDAAAFELPSQLEIGMGYTYNINAQNNLNISGLFQNNNFDGDKYNVGLEYSYDNLIFLRGGYTYAPQMESDLQTYGLAAGVGINYDLGGVGIKLDYAYRENKYFEANHVFGMRLGF